jgi:hypothetical protein
VDGGTSVTTNSGGVAQSAGAVSAGSKAKAAALDVRENEIAAIRAKFLHGDELTAASDGLLHSLPEAGAIILWCGVLAVVLAGPPLASRAWRRRSGR